MEEDARVWIAALRSGHDHLAGFAAGASARDLRHRSMCADWNVAQVLSHLGSGAEIGLAALRGVPVDSIEVWARWNAIDLADMASSFVSADDELVAWYEALSDDELSTLQVQLPFLPAAVDAVYATSVRLSESALHGWDVFAAFDAAATLALDATVLLIDRLPAMVGFAGRFTPRATRPMRDTTIRVTTSNPQRRYELELGDHLDLRPASDGSTVGELLISAEALLRLAAGRLVPGREAAASITGVLTLDQLRTAFPGY